MMTRRRMMMTRMRNEEEEEDEEDEEERNIGEGEGSEAEATPWLDSITYLASQTFWTLASGCRPSTLPAQWLPARATTRKQRSLILHHCFSMFLLPTLTSLRSFMPNKNKHAAI